MNGAAAYRARFLSDTVATAGPAKLLTMLYDRLLLDLERAAAAFLTGDRAQGVAQVGHAQQIVGELIADLDVDAWEGGPRLQSLYSFALSELIVAGTTADPVKVTSVHELLSPLRDAWHEAAAAISAQAAAPQARPVEASAGVLGVG